MCYLCDQALMKGRWDPLGEKDFVQQKHEENEPQNENGCKHFC